MSASSYPNSLPRGLAGYTTLLKQNRDVRHIWTSQVISQMGDWFNSVALLGLINTFTKDPLAVVLVTMFAVLPSALFGLTLSGFIADHVDRKKLVVVMDVARAVMALLMLLVREPGMLWLAYAATAAMSICESMFNPAISAALPNLCKPHELATANALQQSTWASVSLLGAALGGVVAQLFGRDVAFIVNAISFLGSAWAILQIKGQFKQPSSHALTGRASLHSLTEGFSFLREHPRLLAFSLTKTIWAFSFAGVGLFSVYSFQIYNSADIGTSLLYAARGAGSTLGPLIAQSQFMPQRPRDYAKLLLITLAMCVVGYAVWGISGSLAVGMLAIFFGHLGGGNVWTFSRMMVQKETPDYVRGRVLALDTVGFSLVTGIFSLLIGLVARQSAPVYGVLLGTGITLVGLIAVGVYFARTVMKDDRVM